MLSLSWLRFRIRRTPLYAALRAVRDRNEVRRWKRDFGSTGPAPHAIKVRTLCEYATKYSLTTLIETGTYYGDTIWRVRKKFQRIISIEIDPNLVANARRRFAGDDSVSFLVGDSGKILPLVLRQIDTPCLFWLDGHYSGEITGRGAVDSPIMEEINHIWDHPEQGHVILIDDARDFTGRGGYPTIPDLREAVHLIRPSCGFEVRDDIIRITPGHQADAR